MITGPLKEMLARNAQYAITHKQPAPLIKMSSVMRASRAGVVVISCSDPRLNPYQVLGLDSGLRATMIRNAGGRVMDAMRSLTVLQTIGGPGIIVVMHHTDCGMSHFHDADCKKALIEIAPSEQASIEVMKFGEIMTPIEETIREDVKILKASPLIRKDTQIIGLAYDINTGVLTEVKDKETQL